MEHKLIRKELIDKPKIAQNCWSENHAMCWKEAIESHNELQRKTQSLVVVVKTKIVSK